MTVLPKMYAELASWWPLLSRPSDYREEVEFFLRVLHRFADGPIRTMLELGSGGGNNASHFKTHSKLTLVDLSPEMVAVSRSLNPGCEHLVGDMRTVRLEREFDAVFIHDAIMYMLTEADLREAIQTAFVHCHPGGIALLVPDHLRETFEPRFQSGGHDDGKRGIRYLQWEIAPEPGETTTISDFVYILRDGSSEPQVLHDRHRFGLFSRQTWIDAMTECGFETDIVPDVFRRELFVGRKPL